MKLTIDHPESLGFPVFIDDEDETTIIPYADAIEKFQKDMGWDDEELRTHICVPLKTVKAWKKGQTPSKDDLKMIQIYLGTDAVIKINPTLFQYKCRACGCTHQIHTDAPKKYGQAYDKIIKKDWLVIELVENYRGHFVLCPQCKHLASNYYLEPPLVLLLSDWLGHVLNPKDKEKLKAYVQHRMHEMWETAEEVAKYINKCLHELHFSSENVEDILKFPRNG